jgi:aminoglycoside phosphotransferase (APT) family kinase protein
VDFTWAHIFVRQHAEESERAAGYYNHNYVVSHEGETYLVRVPISNSDSMDFRLIPESEVLRYLEGKVFPAPRLLYASPEDGFAVHSFVEGAVVNNVWPTSPVPDWIPQTLAELMAMLHNYHDHGLGHYCAHLAVSPDSQSLFHSLIQHVQGIYRLFYDDYAQYFQRLMIPNDPFAEIIPHAALLQPRPFTFSHCDIHRKNLIVNLEQRSLTILDWELVLITDPVYDITVHFHKMNYTPSQEELFLEHYLAVSPAVSWGASLREQLSIYRGLEQIKSAIVDCVRYVKDLRDPSLSSEQRLDYAARYGRKLERAFAVWQRDFPARFSDPSALLVLLSECGALPT